MLLGRQILYPRTPHVKHGPGVQCKQFNLSHSVQIQTYSQCCRQSTPYPAVCQ